MHGQLGQASGSTDGTPVPAGPLPAAAPEAIRPKVEPSARASRPATRWLKGCARGFLTITAIVVPLVALAAGVLYARLLTGPISASFLVEPIQRVLNDEMPGIQFRIEDAIIQLTSSGGIEARLTSVRVTEDTGSVVALASRASVHLSLRALRSGRIAPARIDLLQPRVVLFAADRPSYMLGYGRDLQGRTLTMPATPAGTTGGAAPSRETEIAKTITIMRDRIDAARQVAEMAGEMRRRKGAASFLETLGLKDASLIVSDDGQQTVLQLPSLELSMRHRSQRSVISGNGTLAGTGAPFKFSFRMEDSERRDRLTLNVDVEELVPRTLALGHVGLELFEGLDLPIVGRGAIELSRQGDVIGGTFDVSLGAGRVHLPWLGKVPLDLAGGELKASYEGSERRLVIAPSTLRWRASHATLQGEIAPVTGNDGAAGWRFEAHGVDGVLTGDDLGAPPLPLGALVVRGTAFPKSGHIDVSEFSMTAGEAKIAMMGTVAASGSERIARLDGRIGPMSLEALKTMWPQGLAPQTRKWVANHLVTGRLSGGAFSMTNERTDRVGPRDPAAFRERALSLTLDGEQIGLEYLKGLPPLEASAARLTVEGSNATLRVPAGIIKTAPTQHLQVQESSLTVSGVDQDRPQARLDVRLAGPASALADLLGRPQLGLIRNAGFDSTGFEGKLDARFSAAFPVHEGLSMQDVQIVEGKASLVEGQARKVMGRYNVSGASIRAEARDNAIDFVGEALLDGVLTKLGWRYSFAGAGAPADAQGLRLRAKMGNSERAQLGIQLGELVNGEVDVDLTVHQGDDDGHVVRVAADLTGAEIQLSDLAWTKPAGQRAELKFDIGKRRDGTIALQNFRLDGDTIGVSGWVALGADNRPVEYFFSDFSLNTVSSLTVRGVLRQDRVWDIKVNGARFDARSIFGGFLSVGSGARQESGEPHQSVGLDLEAKVETVTGVPDVYVSSNPDPRLRGVSLKFSSRGGRVREIDFSGRHENQKMLRASMKATGSAPRLFTVDAEDTGEALKLIGIYRSMRGGEGRLEINLDAAGAAERRGTMRVRKFHIMGDPVVSDMATAYNDGGQPAISQGTRGRQVVREQIEFDRLRASFATGNGQLVIEDMEVLGPILGATLRGKLDYRSEQVHLGGTYTPLSGLNRALSGVPLFGEVLTGPRREGIVAMTFAIQGPMANPQFVPNPLSLVTPGIFRELFQMAPNNPTVTPGTLPSQKRRPAPQPQTMASPPSTGPSEGSAQAAPSSASPEAEAGKATPKQRARARVTAPEITDGWAATTDPRAGTRARN
jgi:hypothetical protein